MFQQKQKYLILFPFIFISVLMIFVIVTSIAKGDQSPHPIRVEQTVIHDWAEDQPITVFTHPVTEQHNGVVLTGSVNFTIPLANVRVITSNRGRLLIFPTPVWSMKIDRVSVVDTVPNKPQFVANAVSEMIGLAYQKSKDNNDLLLSEQQVIHIFSFERANKILFAR